MKRPAWCPHRDCKFKVNSQEKMCFGELPNPEPHDDDFNTNRLCIDKRETGHGIFDLQVNKTDLWNLKRIITTSDPIHPTSEVKDVSAEECIRENCNIEYSKHTGDEIVNSSLSAVCIAAEQYHNSKKPTMDDACTKCNKDIEMYSEPECAQSRMMFRKDLQEAAYTNGFINCYNWLIRKL